MEGSKKDDRKQKEEEMIAKIQEVEKTFKEIKIKRE